MNIAEEKKEFTRDELLEHFAEALNKGRRRVSPPCTEDLEVKKWELYFKQAEKKIYSDIAQEGIDTIPKLKEYMEKLGIIWANEFFHYSKSLMWP